MEAMQYEYLIRRVNNSGRNRGTGADADIYRRVQHAQIDLTTKSMFKTQEDREYEYRSSFAAVRGYVEKAIKNGSKQIASSVKQEESSELQVMLSTLDFDFYDKEKLDKIIKRADDIFHSHGLEMR